MVGAFPSAMPPLIGWAGALLVLMLLALLRTFAALSSTLYRIGVFPLSLGFLYYRAQFVFRRSNSAARRLLAASIIYLPPLFVLMIFTRG
jgi:heme O synthase-like polyprenyltransferase